MSCETSSRNATPPEPAIAPAVGGAPSAEDIDAGRVAAELVARHGGGGIDPRVPALVRGFDAPFFQAGLAGYSDGAMRLIARDHGCPFCVTEALLDIALLGGGRGFQKADLGDLADNIPGGEDDHPLAGQIMGSDPGQMAAAAVKLVEQGRRAARLYRDTESVLAVGVRPADRTFAAIDVNLACPVKKIRTKARGGHWLAEPEGAIEILRAVRAAVPESIPVTVKMRRAFDDTQAMARAFMRIYDAAYDLGCAWVTVHARTVRQKYVGPSRWDLLREIVQARPGRVVFGSGDVWRAADIFRMIAYTGVTGASVARGCIGNPWIFRQARDLLAGRSARPPGLMEQRAVLERHYGLALAVNARLVRASSDDERLIRAGELTGRTMRKFGIQFARHHAEASSVRAAFARVQMLEDWRAVLDAHYPGPAEGAWPDDDPRAAGRVGPGGVQRTMMAVGETKSTG